MSLESQLVSALREVDALTPGSPPVAPPKKRRSKPRYEPAKVVEEVLEHILGPGELPGAPIGDRVLLLPDPPKEETEYKIHIPDIAKVRPNTGKLLDAGLSALDKLHDQGIEIGDEVIWGQFAGVIWEWDHIKEYGPKPCKRNHLWSRMASPRDRVTAAKCDNCNTVRWTECVLLANVDDIQASVALGVRRRAGTTTYKRGKTAEGSTMHYIDRKGN